MTSIPTTFSAWSFGSSSFLTCSDNCSVQPRFAMKIVVIILPPLLLVLFPATSLFSFRWPLFTIVLALCGSTPPYRQTGISSVQPVISFPFRKRLPSFLHYGRLALTSIVSPNEFFYSVDLLTTNSGQHTVWSPLRVPKL